MYPSCGRSERAAVSSILLYKTMVRIPLPFCAGLGSVAAMDIHITNQLTPPPDVPTGRAVFEWHAQEGGSVWAATDELIPGWAVAMRFDLRDGRAVVSEYRIYPQDDQRQAWETPMTLDSVPDGGLTASAVKNVRFAPLRDAALNVITDPYHPSFSDPEDWLDLVRPGGFDPVDIIHGDMKPRRGRRPELASTLALVAILYGRAIRAGHPKPIQWVREQMDEPSSTRVSQLVDKARKRGYLGLAPAPGVAGGHALPKAYETLGIDIVDTDSVEETT